MNPQLIRAHSGMLVHIILWKLNLQNVACMQSAYLRKLSPTIFKLLQLILIIECSSDLSTATNSIGFLVTSINILHDIVINYTQSHVLIRNNFVCMLKLISVIASLFQLMHPSSKAVTSLPFHHLSLWGGNGHICWTLAEFVAAWILNTCTSNFIILLVVWFQHLIVVISMNCFSCLNVPVTFLCI